MNYVWQNESQEVSGASPGFLEWRRAVDAMDDTRSERLVMRLQPTDKEAVVALYRDANENRRWWAIRALAELGDGSVADIPVRAMADPSADIRAASAYCCAQMAVRIAVHEPQAAQRLIAAVTRLLLDDLGFVRQAAADALAQAGELAIPALRGVLRGADESARTRAAYALGKIQSGKAAADLYALLEDANPLVRLYAREALEDLGVLDMVYFRA